MDSTQTVRGRSVKVDASFVDIVEKSGTLVALIAGTVDIGGLELAGTRAFARSGSVDWLDPVVGARVRYAVAPGHELFLRGDIGGFGVGSDFSWQAAGGYGFGFGTYNSITFSGGSAIAPCRLTTPRAKASGAMNSTSSSMVRCSASAPASDWGGLRTRTPRMVEWVRHGPVGHKLMVGLQFGSGR
jgi:hypothetical protein